MMNFEKLILWFMVMLPLIMSPGPANVATASIASLRGFRAITAFVCGTTLINSIAALSMGTGMGLVYVKYQSLFRILEYLGAAYIIYLGIKILRFKSTSHSKSGTEGRSLGFRDGVLIQALNAKLYPSLTMMFSQFIDGDSSTGREVLLLSALLVGTALINYFIWAWLGIMLNTTQNPIAKGIQRYGFGTMLVLIGLCLLFH